MNIDNLAPILPVNKSILMATKGRIDMLVRLSCLLLLLMGNSYSQRDKLLQGEELKDGDELLSTFGKFKLGFFTPSYSSKRYIGVWYQSGYYGVVWVANRNSPIIGKSGSLRLDSTDGNLKIFHSGGNPIAITSFEGARNTSVTLDQSGNLVLHELHSNGSIKGMLWQSFDYPTHTLLPGMKLGINLQNGHQWLLRSWLTIFSPAEGSYTFGMDPNLTDRLLQGQQLKDGDELLSTFGKFNLRFFSPQDLTNHYLGVWFNRPKDVMLMLYEEDYYELVWVAHWNSPISDHYGCLTIDSSDGNLKILHSRGSPISISSVQGSGKTSVTLLQSGNLVLHETSINGSIKLVLWQSFDYPTDTLLPEMKLGINLQTGRKWFLHSWLTDSSPAQGSFTLGKNPNASNLGFG
ncbi:hypothetical protein Q3G72_023698 [Acer saccharum]|nr:hypothetical protein Q3G72_023698 [Acer saccharum]